MDTGPLVALLDRDDAGHAACQAALAALSGPMITTLPVVTEAMYLLNSRFGWRGQKMLWSMLRQDRLQVVQVNDDAFTNLYNLMEKYADIPMDFADASLVAVAENLDVRRIFTLDSHFYAYRFKDRRAFDIVPAP